MDLERVVVRFMADATSYNRVMDGVDARLRNFARSAGGLASFIVSPIAAATESLVALTRVVVDSGRYAVHTAMQYEQLGIQLEVIAKDADKGKQMLEDMFQVAINTPFQVKEVAAAGKELAAFGFSVEEIVPLVKQLGDVSAGTGTPMHRLILAFGQAKIAGRLMGQEMRQFVNANVPMIEHLAAVLGKPTLQIKKMIENGQIGFDIVQQAMNRMTGEGGIFGGMMERMNKTAIGQWRSFIESLEIGLYKVGKVFFEVFDLQDTFRSWKEWAMDTSQDAGGLKQAFENLKEVLHSLRSAALITWEVFKRIGGGIWEIIEAVKEWGQQNQKTVLVLTAILALTTSFRIAVFALTAAFSLLRTVLLTVRALLGINALISAWAGLSIAITTILSPLGILVGLLAGVVYWFSQMDGISEVFQGFGDSVSRVFKELGQTFRTVWDGVKDAINAKEFGLAFDILFKGVQIAFRSLILAMKAEWKNFTGGIGPGAVNDIAHGAEMVGLGVSRWQLENMPSMMEKLMGMPADDIRKYLDKKEKDVLRHHSAVQGATQERVQKEIDDMITNDPRMLQLKKELDILRGAAARAVDPIETLSDDILKMTMQVSDLEMRKRSTGSFYGILAGEQFAINDLFAEKMDMKKWQFREFDFLNKEIAGGRMFGRDAVDAYERYNAQTSKVQELEDKISEIRNKPYMEAYNVTQIVRGVLQSAAGVPGGVFNTGAVQYSLSGEAKSLAERVQQQYMRGVGEETHKYDYFMKNMGLIDQARTGMTPDYKAAFDAAGPISKMFLQAGASKNSALSADEADYGLLNEFDKIKKYVGDRMSTGPRAMAFGSSEAQDTINRAVTQQVPVLDQIRTIMEAAKDMQRQQLEYQKQAVDALRELSGSKPPAAPMPREAGFAVDKP